MKKILFTYLLLWCFAGLTAQYHSDNRIIKSGNGLGTNESACTSITLGVGFSFSSDQGKSLCLKIEDSACFPFIITSVNIASNQNYIVTMTPMGETSSVSFMDGDLIMDRSADKSVHANVSIQYLDGLGYPNQTTQVGITPEKKHLISLQEYDPFGRKSSTWLPVSSSEKTFVENENQLKENIIAFYNDNKPFSVPVYEASPLNRVLEQYGPGNDWGDNKKSLKTDYLTNNSSYPCIRFNIKGNGQNTSLSESGNYEDGELYVIESKDEDGKVSNQFKDKLGQVVLTRQINKPYPTSKKVENHDTYYVYDDFGNLSYVLPPMLVDAISKGKSTTDDGLEMKQYAYLYKYDERNRCVKKRLPGCDWIEYKYDEADRLIFSQNGEQRKKGDPSIVYSPGKWACNIYDALGRVVITGEAQNVSSEKVVSAKFQGKNWSWFGGYELENIGFTVNLFEPHTVNYYDNYDFLERTEFKDLNDEEKAAYNTRYGNNSDKVAAKGLLTGTVVAILDGGTSTPRYLYTAIYYDDKGHAVQTRSTNHLDGIDITYTAYNFTGQPTKALHEHTANKGGITYVENDQAHQLQMITEEYVYSYDHAGRLLETMRNGVSIEKNAYNELGQLAAKNQGGNALSSTYTYNIRGWLTEQQEATTGFKQNLKYQDPLRKMGYNGNISETTYSYRGQSAIETSYSYDELNRLKYTQAMDGLSQHFEENQTFDKHGNITSITRGIDATYTDMYQISYKGNQMDKIDNELGGGYINTISYPEGLGSFTYNENGSLTSDSGRGIASIQYNSLNLPEIIQFTNGNAIYYTYSASGQKLSVKHITIKQLPVQPITNGDLRERIPTRIASELLTNYIGNIVYEETGLFSFSAAGKRLKVLFNGGYDEYVGQEGVKQVYLKDTYYLQKDYLGGTRDVIDARSKLNVQRTEYNPFGTPLPQKLGDAGVQRYKFGGKELDQMHGLNWCDFHARPYDPVLNRFATMDPLAEKYYSVSPYAYCNNNPLRYVDPTGMTYHEKEEEIFLAIDGRPYQLPEITVRPSPLQGSTSMLSMLYETVQQVQGAVLDYVIRKDHSPLITDLAVTGEFLLGCGPQDREFDSNSSSSRSLARSHTTTVALRRIMNEYANGKTKGSAQIGFNPFEQSGSGPFIEALKDNNYNTAQFVGSVQYDYEVVGNSINITVSNTTSQNSAAYHIPFVGKPSRSETYFGITGNINQIYRFSISVDDAQKRVRPTLMF